MSQQKRFISFAILLCPGFRELKMELLARQMICHTAADPEAYPDLPSEVSMQDNIILHTLNCVFPPDSFLSRLTTSLDCVHWNRPPLRPCTSPPPSATSRRCIRRLTSRRGSTCACGGSTATGWSTQSAWGLWTSGRRWPTATWSRCAR